MLPKKCVLCKQKQDTLYWHLTKAKDNLVVFCSGKCQRLYTIQEYAMYSGLPLKDILKDVKNTDFVDAKTDTILRMPFPNSFLNITHPEANPGKVYLQSRGLKYLGNWFYDSSRHGIALPYYYRGEFCGAQIRYINPKENKIVTVPGTRNSYLFYNWDQSPLYAYKGLIVCEGAFNSISIEQSLLARQIHSFKCISLSGSNLSDYQAKVLFSIKEQKGKVVLCPDSDEAGMKLLKKGLMSQCITHYALTNEAKDWNDKYKVLGLDFLDYFQNQIRKVGSL